MWCICCWIHEKKQLLCQQSCGWALCHVCCAKSVGAMELCLPSLSLPSPGGCTASFLLGKVSCGSGQGWGHLGAAAESRESLGAAGSKLGTCSSASVCVLVWGWALRVPNEHRKMAHLHCWLFQQTKENLIISLWLAGSKFCWAARKDGEGPCYLKNLSCTCMKQLCCGTTAAWAALAEAVGRFLGCQVLRVGRDWAIPSSEEKTGTNYHPALACAALTTLTEQLIHSLAITCILWNVEELQERWHPGASGLVRKC